jgi:hypothetical protein
MEASDNTSTYISSPISQTGCALSFLPSITCKLQVTSIYIFFLPYPKPEISKIINCKDRGCVDEGRGRLRYPGAQRYMVEKMAGALALS